MNTSRRRCSKCLKHRAKTKFYPKKGGRDGLDRWCIDCHKAYKDAARAARPPKPPKPPKTPKTHHTCQTCGRRRLMAAFNKNRTKSGGYDVMCKTCRRQYYKKNGYFRKWYAANKARKQAQSRQRYNTFGDVIKLKIKLARYGLSVEEYRVLVETHNNQCAICLAGCGGVRYGKPIPLLIDHDHSTGRVRGLLCERCNYAIGLLRDDPALCRSAAAYLEKNAKWNTTETTVVPPSTSIPASPTSAATVAASRSKRRLKKTA